MVSFFQSTEWGNVISIQCEQDSIECCSITVPETPEHSPVILHPEQDDIAASKEEYMCNLLRKSLVTQSHMHNITPDFPGNLTNRQKTQLSVLLQDVL